MTGYKKIRFKLMSGERLSYNAHAPRVLQVIEEEPLTWSLVPNIR